MAHGLPRSSMVHPLVEEICGPLQLSFSQGNISKSNPTNYFSTTLLINFADAIPLLLAIARDLMRDMKSSPWNQNKPEGAACLWGSHPHVQEVMVFNGVVAKRFVLAIELPNQFGEHLVVVEKNPLWGSSSPGCSNSSWDSPKPKHYIQIYKCVISYIGNPHQACTWISSIPNKCVNMVCTNCVHATTPAISIHWRLGPRK